MPLLGGPLDFAKYEGRNFRAHILTANPAAPVSGQLYFNDVDKTLWWYDGTTWQSGKGSVPDATTTTKGIVQLAGDLTGTAASPQIAAGAVTDAEVAAANKDGAVGTYSMRTIGTGAQQAMAGNTRLDTIAAPLNPVSLNSQRITSLAAPVATTDAANKQYVDGLIQGLDSHPSVVAATTANLPNLITGGCPNVIDGVSLGVGARILVKDQALPAQNGIYSVVAVGTGSNGQWSRATDMDSWLEVPSAYVWVEQGTVNADTGWLCISDAGGTIDSTSMTWTQFSGAGQITAGAGLTKSGNSLDVGAGAGITVNADTIQVANNGITNAMIADGAINLGTADVTGTLPVAGGGTGQTTAKAARETGLAAAGYYSSATHGAGTTISIPQATHGLRASRGLQVQVLDEATGNVEIPDVNVAANGDVLVTYGAAFAANSKRVTVVG